MAQVTKYGSYTVPAARVGIVLDHLREVAKNHSISFSKEEFIHDIGAVPSSNGPADKLRDMIQYGLIMRDDHGLYKITDLGKAAISDTVEEKSLAITNVIRNVPLWDKLSTSLGTKTTMELFANAVKQIVGLDDKEFAENIHRLWYAYTEDIKCITKTPPYSSKSAILGKRRVPKHQENQTPISHTVNSIPQNEPECYFPEAPIQPVVGETEAEKQKETPPKQDILAFFERGEIAVKKLTFNADGLVVEVKDVPSYYLAQVFLQAKMKGIKRGVDYEQH
jgi:hypothetical protein